MVLWYEASLFALELVGVLVQIPTWLLAVFFFHRIFTLGLVFVFSHCRPFLASREFCDNVFLVNYYQSY